MVSRSRFEGVPKRAILCAVFACLATSSSAQQAGTLVWGGAMPTPGEAYRPSPSAVDPIETRSAPAPEVPAIQPSADSIANVIANDFIANPPIPRPNALLPVSQPSPAPSLAALPPQVPVAVPEPVPMRTADEVFGGTSLPDLPRQDPWVAMKEVTPGALTKADRLAPKAPPAPLKTYASLEPRPAPRIAEPEIRKAPPVTGTPSGWRNLSHKEALCRAALVQLGVEFTEPAPITTSKSCSVPHPVKVSRIAKGVVMSPAATLNCDAAFRISRWVDQEVKPAARSNLGTDVTVLKNSSSYRCSRVAGSGGVSQHASGNALDVASFVTAGGREIDIEKKGIFSPSERGFQKDIRKSACRWFGTVLGPGYDYLHRNHFHLDARERPKKFCR